MATSINIHTKWSAERAASTHKTSVYSKFIAFADRQTERKTFWFMVSLVVQGVFFLPLPAVLMYYFNAPIVVLVITLLLYFANIIAGMGGSSIRVIISLFAVSVLINLLMLALCVF